MFSTNVLKRPTLPVVLGVAAIALAQMNVAVARSPVTISGTPPSAVTVGQTYSFTPATNRSPKSVRFSVSNKPGWMTFSSYKGTLYGVPSSANIGTYSNITITVTDGSTSATLAPFSVTVNGAPTATPTPTPTPTPTNTPPTISGTPVTVVNSGQTYSFQPTASDADGNALTFSISGKPTWASFNSSTGLLSGAPAYADAGVYSNIIISVSDGQATTSLPAFAVTVNQVANGSASLSWLPPTTNTDGTTLTDLAGFRVEYGTSASALSTVSTISNPSVSSAVISNLAPGTWYFAVTAYTSAGLQSAVSTTVTKTIQ